MHVDYTKNNLKKTYTSFHDENDFKKSMFDKNVPISIIYMHDYYRLGLTVSLPLFFYQIYYCFII